MKNTSHRYDMNITRSSHKHKYSKCKKYLSMMMLTCITQHLSKWLIGQRHESLNGAKVEITVDFDHECLNRKSDHKICFPIVGACGKNILLPVSHMISSTPEFQRIFLLAFLFSRR